MPCQAEGLREPLREGEGERVGSYARARALIPKFLFSLGAKEDFTCEKLCLDIPFPRACPFALII